ncbi:NAD(P)/FAD-dependent oxidoreductase [Micromonospora sp. NPDC052213]|uniref:flavin-containing monooxygenase n=1 Tax=Micromonospora sp. NPDC052213 TaxID=3155812 RepID=UPI0034236110
MTEILIIGAGQAGLAAGYELRRAGFDVLLLDAGTRVGDAWRNRWDSLRLFTPARHSALPGLPFPAPPGHYPSKDEVADYLAAYAEHHALPVEHGAAVRLLRRTSEGAFEAVTPNGVRTARAVVVATGPFQVPHVPALSDGLAAELVQLHSVQYRRPADLPDGPVLVVGGGNSGMQIAAELAASRSVTLSLGTRQPVLPQRPFGVDIFTWLDVLGLVRAPAEGWLGRRIRARDPLIETGPRALRRRGVRVVGRVTGAQGRALRTADGQELTPSVVLWATGFRADFGWLRVPGAVDPADGLPVHVDGVSPVPGLCYVGLPFQRNRGSALLGWVGRDAAVISSRLRASTRTTSRGPHPESPGGGSGDGPTATPAEPAARA